jgi:hypothetical protein
LPVVGLRVELHSATRACAWLPERRVGNLRGLLARRAADWKRHGAPRTTGERGTSAGTGTHCLVPAAWVQEKKPARVAPGSAVPHARAEAVRDSPNVACLDYSVAKGGFLCAYRWDGEQKLTSERLVWVAAVS